MPYDVQRFGARGPQVRALQTALQRAGFDPGAENGVFGPRTDRAVRDFQRSRRLAADGVVGEDTWRALDAFEEPRPRPSGRIDLDALPRTGNEFIDSVAADAVRSQRETGVPASVVLAQAILESNWGKSGLAQEAHNYFSIKGEGPAGHVRMRTREVFHGRSTYVYADFRRYHDATESFVDHGQFLRDNPRYAPCFRARSTAEFCRQLQKCGYATDPKYATLLQSIIRSNDLEQFDGLA